VLRDHALADDVHERVASRLLAEGLTPVTEFNDYSDPRLPYMFHCHVLQHEDRGMMGQFAVLEPGQEAQTPPPDSTGYAHQEHGE